jgi:signal transduction histidine kinase
LSTDVTGIERDAASLRPAGAWTLHPGRPGSLLPLGRLRETITFAATLVVALAVSLTLAVVGPHALSYPTTEAALESCALLAALAGAWALLANVGSSKRLRQLLLCAGLVMLALVDLVSLDGPTLLALRSPTALEGAPAIVGLLAAATFLAAALAPPQRTLRTRRPWRVITVAAGVAAAGIAELGSWLADGELAPRRASHMIVLPTRPLETTLLVAGVLLASLAAAVFLCDSLSAAAGRARRDAWGAPLLAAAVMLPAIGAGCIDWFRSPSSLQAPTVPATGMWLAPLCLMSVAAVWELAAQRHRASAILAERHRQRLARDLHDGICQDLAFIAAHAARDGDDHPMALAARRALALSRGALAELSASDAPTTQQALRRVADELAARFGIAIDVHARPTRLRADERDALVRITREAVVNAVKHGHAEHVLVTLQVEEGRLVLRVRDNGRGIQPAGLLRPGFGRMSMHQRAAELGGSLAVRACEEGGTELEVLLP